MSPAIAPGVIHKATATKEVLHGAPCIEDHFPGLAFKTKQEPWAGVTSTDLQTIAVGEDFNIVGGGKAMGVAKPGGAAVGDPVWINEATNALSLSDTAGTNEVQVLTFTTTGSVQIGGTTQISFDGETSGNINATATGPQILAALEAMSNIDPGDVAVVVSGTAQEPIWTLTFSGQYASENVPAVTATSGSLTGTGAAVAVTTPTAGAAGAGMVKFGRIEAINGSLCDINTNSRDTF